MVCQHLSVTCINPYDYIRKYRCDSCGELMICTCDEVFARRYLPHQISEGAELETQAHIPVTLGFQPNICNACRGLTEESAPIAALYGRSSKIHRYYWREIGTETIRRFADWAASEGIDNWLHAQGMYQSKKVLNLPFQLVKIHKKKVRESVPESTD